MFDAAVALAVSGLLDGLHKVTSTQKDAQLRVRRRLHTLQRVYCYRD